MSNHRHLLIQSFDHAMSNSVNQLTDTPTQEDKVSQSRPRLTAGDLTAQKLFDLLGEHRTIEVDQYSLGVDKDIFNDLDIWMTDPYGCDLGWVPYSVESAGRVLDRISKADPNGTERDPW